MQLWSVLRLGVFGVVALASVSAQAGPCLENSHTAAGDEAQFSYRTPTRWWVFVCGKKENSFGKDVYSEFDVLVDSGAGPQKVQWSVASSERYSIQKSNEGIALFESALIDNYWLPLFKRELKCNTSGCKLSAPVCVHQRMTKLPKSGLSMIRYYEKEALRKSSAGQATDPAELDVVLAAALGGEADSVWAFRKNPGFRLDGNSAERYEYGRNLLKRVGKQNCRTVPLPTPTPSPKPDAEKPVKKR